RFPPRQNGLVFRRHRHEGAVRPCGREQIPARADWWRSGQTWGFCRELKYRDAETDRRTHRVCAKCLRGLPGTEKAQEISRFPKYRLTNTFIRPFADVTRSS